MISDVWRRSSNNNNDNNNQWRIINIWKNMFGGCVWSITDYMSRIELMILNDEVELFNYHVRYIATKLRIYTLGAEAKSDLRNVSRRTKKKTWTHKSVFFTFFFLPEEMRKTPKERRSPWKYNRHSRRVFLTTKDFRRANLTPVITCHHAVMVRHVCEGRST